MSTIELFTKLWMSWVNLFAGIPHHHEVAAVALIVVLAGLGQVLKMIFAERGR